MKLSRICILILSLLGASPPAVAGNSNCPSLHNSQTNALNATIQKAAFIGPTNDWKPLLEGAKEFGISQESLDQILNAGMEMRCPSDDLEIDLVGNAWMLDTIRANAHAFYDDNDVALKNPERCELMTYRDLLSKESLADMDSAFRVDLTNRTIGTTHPKTDDVRKDVSSFGAIDAPPYLKGLEVEPGSVTLNKGQEIFLISRRPAFLKRSENDFEPLIQQATVKFFKPPQAGLPGAVMTDADVHDTVSGGMYMVRSKNDPSKLVPVAMHKAAKGDVDYKEWDGNTNTGIGIVLSPEFFRM